MGIIQDILNNEVVENLMIPELISPKITMNSNYFDIVNLMTEYNIGAVFVTSKSGKLEGVVTDGDIRRAFKSNGPIPLFNMSIKEIATKKPLSCNPSSSLYEAMKIMELGGKKITCLPIIDSDENLYGVITMHLIIGWLLKQ